MKQIQKYDTSTGKHYAEALDNNEVGFWNRHRSLLGKILLELNYLKRRRLPNINVRWEILPNYHATSGWTTGTWNPVKFGKEILKGDRAYITANGWKFRAQVQGTYLVSSNVTISATEIQDASLAIYKNGTIWSRIKTIQNRIFDVSATEWHYHTTVDLAGASDQVWLNVGDEVEIRCYYVGDTSGGGIGKIVGWVNVTLVGNNEGVAAAPADLW